MTPIRGDIPEKDQQNKVLENDEYVVFKGVK